mmetsp:Transcript_134330/g.251377  ORF Transcript_134330/g.251377 Transcript_134330/m.251377 type:complete len:288 (-) Transcript_134330:1718-2581(-)
MSRICAHSQSIERGAVILSSRRRWQALKTRRPLMTGRAKIAGWRAGCWIHHLDWSAAGNIAQGAVAVYSISERVLIMSCSAMEELRVNGFGLKIYTGINFWYLLLILGIHGGALLRMQNFSLRNTMTHITSSFLLIMRNPSVSKFSRLLNFRLMHKASPSTVACLRPHVPARLLRTGTSGGSVLIKLKTPHVPELLTRTSRWGALIRLRPHTPIALLIKGTSDRSALTGLQNFVMLKIILKLTVVVRLIDTGTLHVGIRGASGVLGKGRLVNNGLLLLLIEQQLLTS